ncbi:MAG: BACON domain-containing protein [Dehalococcoidia bacterium]|nr:BACON domain-containing protein [Dehalococcoidia bacterium]
MDDSSRCPQCGSQMHYDAATGFLWCPRAECGFVARRVPPSRENAARPQVGRATVSTSGAPARVFEDEGVPVGPRGRRWRLVVGTFVLMTIAAVLLTTVAPVLLPQIPVLSVSSNEIIFDDLAGTGVMPQALAIRNQGKGRLEWHAGADVPWLTIEPQSGSTESELQIFTISADTRALPEGTHSATVLVTADGARNSPQVVLVHVQLATPLEARAIRDVVGENVDVFYGVQPPYVNGPLGEAVNLVRVEGRRDVTWQELMDFLLQDPTDESPYVQDVYMCGGFSETLYNNAAAAGIRAAWVSLDIRDRAVGHALNAFFTTDRGLVFVDCTGGDTSAVVLSGSDENVCEHDRIAYVHPGLEYGLVSIDRAESPAYDFYQQYAALWDVYVLDLGAFNRLVAEYNALVRGRTLIAGSADARQAQALRRELEASQTALQLQLQVLGDCRWVSLGVVDSVRIYW